MRLISRTDGTGRVPAVELLLGAPHVRELLAAGKNRDLSRAIAEGEYYGMRSFLQSLTELVDNGIISEEQALASADNPEEFKLHRRGIKRGTPSSFKSAP